VYQLSPRRLFQHGWWQQSDPVHRTMIEQEGVQVFAAIAFLHY
jgi:hypothetical protein